MLGCLRLIILLWLITASVSANDGAKGPFLFISIFSAFSNRPKRDALRRTWLTLVPQLNTPTHPIKYFFILAKPDPLSNDPSDQDLLEEMKMHRDIFLLTGEKDQYMNLMPKLMVSLRMAFGSAHYMLKTDDDSLVDLQKILAILQGRQINNKNNTTTTIGQDLLYYGKIDEESKIVVVGNHDYNAMFGPDFEPCVYRHLKKFIDKGDPAFKCPYVDEILSKHLGYISISRYAHGAGYIVGSGLGARLAKLPISSADTRYEDHTVGQWVRHLDRNMGVPVEYLNDNGIDDWIECAEYMNRTIIHRVTPQRMICIWNVVKDPKRPKFGQHRTCCK